MDRCRSPLRSTLVRSSSNTSGSAMTCSSAPGSRNPFESWPTAMCTATFSSSSVRSMSTPRSSYSPSSSAVRSARPSVPATNSDGVAALAHALDFGDPLLDTAAELDGGLAGNVQRAPLSARSLAPRSRAASSRVASRSTDLATSDQRRSAAPPALAHRGFRLFASAKLAASARPASLACAATSSSSTTMKRQVAVGGQVVEEGCRT